MTTMLDHRHPQRRAGLIVAIGALVGAGVGICAAPSWTSTVALDHPVPAHAAAVSGLPILPTAKAAFQKHNERSPNDDDARATSGASPGGKHGTVSRRSAEASSPEESKSVTANTVAAQDGDAKLVEKLVGRWCREKFGRRVLDVMPDGTARLTVEPSGFWKTLFGERLLVDVEWSLKDGHITYHVKSGDPADKVRLATQMWGSRWTESIESIDENAVILRDVATRELSKWTRLRTDAGAPRQR